MGDYDFTVDWTSQNYETWRSILGPLAGQVGLRFLEIGSFEGRSATWLLDNILTHSTSSIVCVDTFLGSAEHVGMPQIGALEARFRANLARHASKCEVLKGISSELLRAMPRAPSFDAVYVDGSHEPADVLEDAVLSWPLLRGGGLLIFDDYGWERAPGIPGPKFAVDAFMAAYKGLYEVRHRSYQVILAKPQP